MQGIIIYYLLIWLLVWKQGSGEQLTISGDLVSMFIIVDRIKVIIDRPWNSSTLDVMCSTSKK